jgi:NADPH:quinone reductase-like Zn-dependent oxidoreductase
MCGVVGGVELPLTVYPFILRGVTLAGIDSAWCPEDRRAEIWRLLSGEWKPAELAGIATWVDLGGLDAAVQQILKGGVVGRVVVRM